MNFQFEVGENYDISLKDFLKERDFSRRLLNRIKFDIRVNGEERYLKDPVAKGDLITVPIPAEDQHPNIVPSKRKLDIIFEDDHFVVINKEAHMLSTVSWDNPESSVANSLLGYYLDKGTEHKSIHLITRLDRNTSGIMLVAKHQLAHAKMDKLLQSDDVKKEYLAITPKSREILDDHGFIDAPIGRSEHSIVERMVREDGKASLTEYWRIGEYADGDVFKIQLHTGRTHQIRVHFQHVGLPLLGDDLYGGVDSGSITRQALHCRRVEFVHPITKKLMILEAPLPDDLAEWILK